MDDDGVDTRSPLQLTFQRELDSILKSSGLHLSNRLFGLLNKFECKLKKSWYQVMLIQIGDSLSRAKEYSCAQTHGYDRYIKCVMGSATSLAEVITESLSSERKLSLILQAVIGNGLCQYNICLHSDEEFKKKSTLEMSFQVLSDTRICLKAGLKYESLYWLIYNAVTLTYSIARKLLKLNLQKQVIYSLICSCAAIESCIPLKTLKYLTLRTDLYIAICASYYSLKEPLQAELFARKGLDKVYQLAKIENLTSKSTVSSSVLTEATLKLGVMVFKRSVLESHKKTKSILRPKIRPSIRDLLQINWPRSATERLLDEMFCGHSAHFLAILEALSISLSRPMTKKQPTPITNLDEDTVIDVYQELLTAGVDLALIGFKQQEKKDSLLSLAIKGSDIIPMTAIIQFIHLCYQTDCSEGFSMLADTAVELMGSKATNIKVLLICDELQEFSKQGNDEKKIWDKAVSCLDVLCAGAIDKTLNGDLLLDSSLLVWEKISNVYKGITCFVSPKSVVGFEKCFEALRNILFVFDSVQLSVIDPLLYGEIALKYTILLESQADISVSGLSKNDQELLSHYFIHYDQNQLIICLQVIENILQEFANAKCYSSSDNLIQIHTELTNSYWRVKVKLLTTKPPDCPVENTKKPSSLPHKVIERQKELQTWKKIVSLTTPNQSSTPTFSVKNLREECGTNHYHLVLLLSNLATFSHHNDPNSLLREAVSLLSFDDKTTESDHKLIPPPPIALEVSPTAITFSPNPSFSLPVAYYALFGRAITNEMTQVRFNDCHLPGLGVEVSASEECIIRVTGLQPNMKYKFAVAAYDIKGNLLGGSIGHSTKPILTSYVPSESMIWGFLCQSAFQLNNFVLGKSTATVLWKFFVHSFNHNNQELKYNVLVQVQADIHDKFICPDSCDYPLLSSIPNRLNLIRKLLIALEVAGRINNHSFCLQVVVMCYTIIVPLIQACAVNDFLTEVLLRCHAVLQELPENVLNGKHITFGVHHMIAAVSFTLVKHLSFLNEKSLMTSLVEASRLLLTVTLPSTSINCQATSANTTVQNPSLVSTTSMAVTSTLSFASQNSFIPTPQDKFNKQPKKRKKKILTLNDDIPDDFKSVQYKVIGAYFLSQAGIKNNDDLDLTGQEDPVFLHIALKTMPIHFAYKEVTKFKRRPQYLEFFVHLCEIAMSEGKSDLLLNWSNDVFSWLAKRNEILLSIKSPQIYKLEISRETPLTVKTHLYTQVNTVAGHAKMRSSANTELSGFSSQKTKPPSGGTNQSKSVKKSDMSLTVFKQHITRDDIRTKAVVVLQNLIPTLWHSFRCRQKLRAACNEEHSWRAQVNNLLASCVLEKLCHTIKIDSHTCISQNIHKIDTIASLMNVLSCYPPVVPNSTEKFNLHIFEGTQIVNLFSLMILYYQRAAVLSYRGFCWVLLVNACRGLWNALVTLKKFIENRKLCDITLSELFGLSLKSLYMTSIHLLDMYQCVQPNEIEQLSCTNMLTDNSFLTKFVKMTIEVCYINHHWEKTLSLSAKLLSLVRSNTVRKELILIIYKAQDELRQRIQLHSKMCHFKAMDPAAHLDTNGYDLYSKVGHSLGMTTVQPHNIHISVKDNTLDCGEVLLSHAKHLANMYINKLIDPEGDIPTCGTEDISCNFIKAVDQLVKEGKIVLAVDAIIDIGNFNYFSEQLKSASHWWQQGFKLMFQCDNLLKDRQILLPQGANMSKHYYLIGSILASKLAKYIYCNEQSMQLEYFLLAAYFLKCFIQVSCLSHPKRDIDFSCYKIYLDNFFGSEVLRDYNFATILSSLQCTCKFLTDSGYSLEVFPVVCLYEYVAQTYARSVYHTILARIYKLKALTDVELYCDAFIILKELINGTKLPHFSSEFSTNVSNRSSGNDFDDTTFLNSPQNIKVLSFVIDKQSLNSLKGTYNTYLLYEEVVLAMTHLLITLTSTFTAIPSQTNTAINTKFHINGDASVCDVKVALLQTSEGLLQELLQETKGTNNTQRCQVFCLLCEIALSLGHASTAAQLCVLSLKELTTTMDTIDIRLWQRLQVIFAKSLFRVSIPNYILKDFSFMSLVEGKLFNNVEFSSQLLYLSSCHHYTTQPPSLDQVILLTQKCIAKLSSCKFLSTKGKYLIVNAALLLAEVLLIKGTSFHEIQKSYHGIIEMLEHQLNDITRGDCVSSDVHIKINCHRKQLPLLVQARMCMLIMELNDIKQRNDINEVTEIRKRLEETIFLAQNMANSCPGFVSVLFQQFALLDRKEVTFHQLIIKALSSTLPFDYTFLHDLLFLLSQELTDQNTGNVSTKTPSNGNLKAKTDKAKCLYQIWCAVKSAGNIQQHIEKLQYFSSQLHNENMNFLVPMIEVPTVAITDLCHFKKLHHSLFSTASNDSLIVDLPSPFSQHIISEKLSWFDLVSYFWLLLKSSFSYSSHFHLHHFSSSFIPKAVVMFDFLQSNCLTFQKQYVPLIPKSAFLAEFEQNAPTSDIFIDIYHTANDNEITILWHHSVNERLEGLIALNSKAIQGPIKDTVLHTLDLEVHHVTVDQYKLKELYTIWNDLANTCRLYLSQQAVRPLSRSPSRMKQRTIEQSKQLTPSHLMKSIENAVVVFLNTFGIANPDTPQVEPHMVAGIARVLRPTILITEKGDGYYFFKTVFSCNN